MLNKIINSKFVERWGITLSVFFSTGPLVSFVITIASLFLSIKYRNNVAFSNLMAIIGSAFGGIAGAFLKDEYDKLSGKNILEKKGRSAWRNLQGINTQLCNIKSWILEFSKKTKKQEDRRTLDEINRHISTIELNISAGLEDWVDIVPELKEKNQKEAEIDKKYKEFTQSVLVELLEKRKELAFVKDKKIEEELKKKINDLEKQIKEIKKERSGFGEINFGDTLYGGISKTINVSDNLLVSNSFETKRCDNCGKDFYPNYLSTPILITKGNYCPDCQ